MTDKDDGALVDKVLGNPAFDQMYGYHIFFRRAAIPITLFLIGLLTYTLVDPYFSSDTSLTIAFVLVGLSLGLILNLERYVGVLLSRK